MKKQELIHLYELVTETTTYLQDHDIIEDSVRSQAPRINISDTKKTYKTEVLEGFGALADAVPVDPDTVVSRDRDADNKYGQDSSLDTSDAEADTNAEFSALYDTTDGTYPAVIEGDEDAETLYDHFLNRLGLEQTREQCDEILQYISFELGEDYTQPSRDSRQKTQAL